MATKSFRIFATKEDLFSIFFDFQQNVKIHYFKCGRMYDLVEISDITKDTDRSISQSYFFRLGVWLQWQSTDTCTGKSERTVQTDDCKS